MLAATGRNADAGSGDLFVAEADESDGAFLVYHPHAALVTNVDADHLDVWGSVEAYRAAFTEFVATDRPRGLPGALHRRPRRRRLVELAPAARPRVVTVGLGEDCDIRAIGLAFEGSRSTFEVVDGGVALGRVTLQVPGRHYVLDALAALAAGLRLGLPFDGLRAGLEASPAPAAGWSARARPGECGSTTPTRTTRSRSPATCRRPARSPATGAGRLLPAPPGPRTRIFGAAMGAALGAADEVVVLDVYVAREDPDPEVTGAWWRTPYPCRRSTCTSSPTSTTPRQNLSGSPGPVTWF